MNPTNTPQPAPLPPDNLAAQPYVDGFSMRTVFGALFVGLVMMPGSIYLGLIAGQSLGPAAEWVTIILFTEVARRSFATLKRQEIFLLYYVAAALAASGAMVGGAMLAGGPFSPLIWNQYLVQTDLTAGIADQIPNWVAPPKTSPAIQTRSLLHPDWWPAIALLLIGQILGRMSWFGMGYLMFRVTSDIERLPFPLAPIAAEGATALAEITDKQQSWRWNAFSTGAMGGVVFGGLYVLIPALSGLIMAEPIMILPIPFVDFTASTETLLPGALISIGFDCLLLITGMILPFPLTLGLLCGTIATSVIGNPFLYHMDLLPNYHRGSRLLATKMIIDFDFWMSVGIGLAISVALIGIWTMIRVFFFGAGRQKLGLGMWEGVCGQDDETRRPSRERGDFPMWVAAALYLVATTCYVALCLYLVPDLPPLMIGFIIFFGFIWTPLNSYISARMIGLTGMPLAFPFLREGSFLLSGYRGVPLWFAPIPLADFGSLAQRFRELELTRTKITSLIKAELLIIPVSLVCSFVFWSFFWHVDPIPSATYPFTSRIWPVQARTTFLFVTATTGQNSLLLDALDPVRIGAGTVVGVASYVLFTMLGLPLTFFYGFIGGIANFLHASVPIFIGALIGRYYFTRKFGLDNWRRYIPVVAAGFACGMGLISMVGVAIALISSAATSLPF